MIFLSITGSWTAAVVYDRREKKRIQQKWTQAVEHIAKEPANERQMPRKLTVYLSAPPADGLVAARDHFNEYVKPILVAAALDWDAVEGRREGDVRAGLAERIRRLRWKKGESVKEEPELDTKDIIEDLRLRAGVLEWDGPAGDIIIGRHTWKEYVRGLHEGWLGPLDPPASVDLYDPASAAPEAPPAATPVTTTEQSTPSAPAEDASSTSVHETPAPPEAEKPKEEETGPKKKRQPPPFITTTEYSQAQISSTCPQALGPSSTIALPHLLGFFNFPVRMYRFLNRRRVADEAGRQTVAAVLGAYRPYDTASELASSDEGTQWEQQRLLTHEEPEWHKTARERKDGEGERVWLDDMIIDPRIGGRMRSFELTSDEEDRVNNMSLGKEGGSWFTRLWPKKQRQLWEGLQDDLD
jgi:import inner membrane translocase subunit TIM54